MMSRKIHSVVDIIWNEAIEAAAVRAERTGAAAKTRWLETREIYSRELAEAAANSCFFASEAIRTLKRVNTE